MNKEKELLKPKYDVVFRALFRKNNQEITSGFLSDILQIKAKVIEVEKDRYLITKYPEEKLGILDLRTELEGGIKCNVEIQLANQYNTVKRILYYWSRIYSGQLKRGEDFKRLKKTISIMIVDYEIEELKGIEELETRWQIRDSQEGKKVLTDDLEIRIIEIPKAKRIIEKEKENRIAQWMIFLDNPNSEEVLEIMRENENIKNAMEELEEMSEDEELRRVAELKEKYEMEERNFKLGVLEEAEKIKQEAREIEQEARKIKEEAREIREEAKRLEKEGREEGRKEGREEGIKSEKIKMAKAMIKENIQVKTITKITGLTREEIEKVSQG